MDIHAVVATVKVIKTVAKGFFQETQILHLKKKTWKKTAQGISIL